MPISDMFTEWSTKYKTAVDVLNKHNHNSTFRKWFNSYRIVDSGAVKASAADVGGEAGTLGNLKRLSEVMNRRYFLRSL